MNKFKVAVVQLNTQNNYEENIEKLKKYIEEAANSGAKLVVFPEHSVFLGYGLRNSVEEVPNGVTTNYIRQIAKANNIYVHVGSIAEKCDDGRYSNTSFMVDNKGNFLGKYQKIHPFDAELTNGLIINESKRVKSGNRIVTIDTQDFGTIGMSICYDLRFPELYRILTLKGAKIIIVSSNFSINTGKHHWECLLKARAIENACYIIAPNQIGKKANFTAYGDSLVVDPWGSVIAHASEREEMFLVTIDLDYVDEVRKNIGTLSNRREDMYEIIEKN